MYEQQQMQDKILFLHLLQEISVTLKKVINKKIIILTVMVVTYNYTNTDA